jgi:hypothetical protein
MGLVKINLPTADYLMLINESITIGDILSDLFFDTGNYNNILTELNNYHKDEDGAPIVPEFEIDDVVYDYVSKSGKVRLSYTVDFTFACADKQSTTRHTETSNFIINTYIDSKCELLSLFIHDKISRDTYEEF